MKGMTIMFVVMILSLGIASLWSSIPAIKDGVHSALDPTLGILMNWNVTLGLIIITGVLTFLMTLLHKYATDQNLLKEIKDDYVIVAYNSADITGNYYNPSYYNNYNFASGDTRRINLREQTVFNNVVVNLAEVKLNRQAKLHIVPKAFGPRGESNFNFSF